MKTYLFALLTGVTLAGAVFGIRAWLDSGSAARAALPVQERAGSFELVNQDGRTVSLRDGGGKVRLVSFFYVRCANPRMCPAETSRLAEVHGALGQMNRDVVFYRISFDPEHDTPETLREYGRLYGVDFPNWHFLTGEPDAIDAVCDAYDIDAVPTEQGLYKHSMLLYLLDGDGRIRKVYAGMSWQAEMVVGDVKTLLDTQ